MPQMLAFRDRSESLPVWFPLQGRNERLQFFWMLSISPDDRLFVLTGASKSAESGIPTFHAVGGLWRNYRRRTMATLAQTKGSVKEVQAILRHTKAIKLSEERAQIISIFAQVEWA